MSRILFVTVGTSAVTNEEIRSHSPALQESLGDGDPSPLIAQLEEHPQQLDSLKAKLLAAHREFWEERNAFQTDPGNLKRTSAETISTFMALNGYLNRGRDKVVLLVSNTPIGRICGSIDETLFRDYLFGPGKASQGDVIVREVIVVNPKEDEEEPFQVYPQVRRIVEECLRGNECQPLFNITGGYKGLIPPIVHLAWTQYSTRSAEILYMHESGKATVILSPRQGGMEMEERIVRYSAYVR